MNFNEHQILKKGTCASIYNEVKKKNGNNLLNKALHWTTILQGVRSFFPSMYVFFLSLKLFIIGGLLYSLLRLSFDKQALLPTTNPNLIMSHFGPIFGSLIS